MHSTNSMENTPPSEANNSSGSPDILQVSWILMVHLCLHKSPPSFSWARSIESIIPFHTISWRSILILTFHPSIPSAQSLFCSFSNQNPITYQHNVWRRVNNSVLNHQIHYQFLLEQREEKNKCMRTFTSCCRYDEDLLLTKTHHKRATKLFSRVSH